MFTLFGRFFKLRTLYNILFVREPKRCRMLLGPMSVIPFLINGTSHWTRMQAATLEDRMSQLLVFHMTLSNWGAISTIRSRQLDPCR
jgi:hypothetical protein